MASQDSQSVKDENVVWHPHAVTRADREKQHGHLGAVLWFTGLSGSGKSTLAAAPLRLLPDNARLSADRLVFDGRDLMAASPRDLRALRGGVTTDGIFALVRELRSARDD